MSPRVIILLAVVGTLAVSAGAITWFVQPHPVPTSGAGDASPKTAFDADSRAHRERFFSGNAERDIRGGQEMKPRW